MPDTYISRAGIMKKQLDQKFVNTEKEVVLKKLDAERMRGDMLAQKHEKTEETVNTLKSENKELREDVKKLKQMMREAMDILDQKIA